MSKIFSSCLAVLLFSTAAVAGTKIVNGVEVRDWDAVDSNKDHYISPDEMRKHLEEQWAKRKQASEQGK
jgi:hypothetical protein